MGMTEQKSQLLKLVEIANNKENSPKMRILAWCDWGRASRSSHDASQALRNIEDIVRTHYED